MGRTNRPHKANKIYRNKDAENSKKYAEKRNDIITYRLLILFGAAVCVVGFFIFAMNNINGDVQKLKDTAFAGIAVTGIMVMLSAVFFVYRLRQSIDESDRVIQSKSVFIVALLLFACCLTMYYTQQLWIPLMTAVIITATALAYIYYLYQKEFFGFSLFCAVSCLFLYLAGSPNLSWVFRIAFSVLLAAFAVFVLAFAYVLMKSKGRLRNRSLKLNVRIFEKNSKYFQFFILAAFIAGFAAVSFFSIDINFFYLMYSLIAYFIVVGVYFTVKMI